jgi:putative SOS response-associated peptidase YedK
VITTDAEPELAKVHHRMPLVLDQTRWDAWLDPTLTGADEVRGLLDPPEPGLMTMRAVSTDVNNVRNNSRELLNPIPADEVLGDITLF